MFTSGAGSAVTVSSALIHQAGLMMNMTSTSTSATTNACGANVSGNGLAYGHGVAASAGGPGTGGVAPNGIPTAKKNREID